MAVLASSFSAVTQCLRSASYVAWIKNSKSKQRTGHLASFGFAILLRTQTWASQTEDVISLLVVEHLRAGLVQIHHTVWQLPLAGRVFLVEKQSSLVGHAKGVHPLAGRRVLGDVLLDNVSPLRDHRIGFRLR